MPTRKGSGYYWAETVEGDGALIVLVLIDETGAAKGYVPGREGAINLSQIVITGAVAWPGEAVPAPNLDLRCFGAPAADVVPGCSILPFAVSA